MPIVVINTEITNITKISKVFISSKLNQYFHYLKSGTRSGNLDDTALAIYRSMVSLEAKSIQAYQKSPNHVVRDSLANKLDVGKLLGYLSISQSARG